MAATGLITTNNRQTAVVNRKQTVLVNQSARVTRKLDDLLDVNTSGKIQGSFLVYDATTQTFIASNTLDNQVIDGGSF